MPNDHKKRESISTAAAPAAVGPYSQALKTEALVFLSGQIGLVPETGKLAEGGVAAQTSQALKNLAAVLQAAGSAPNQVVKTTVFITDPTDFKIVNELYAKFFPDPCPARSCVVVSALPLRALVEIEAVAIC